ncbi:probable endo-beta-1,4-glucanase B [Aspergillus lentulus]|uniref:uncharacterized protein n=1 Tax=Aspergillus lentulus TaxID=293939 RepID=UPI001395898E|nr:probable endo-beta-1,4-glucanase B [Aspergillus lentulus]GFF37833.1 probable endo-beta-1,4-glucanase B [Aspergillus lentulus]GFF57697.1 probable endo-beta-1,4-glucanase B [Aspergillus lentulus]
MRFIQFFTAVSTASLALAAPPKSKTKRTSAFQWFGSNESGAEFGSGNIPGMLGTDYIWPNTTAISILRDAGMNIFRVPFAMERLVPNNMTGSPDATYMADLVSTINYITSTGAHAIIDPHNFGRYYGNIITSTTDFAAFWTTVATQFKDNDLVIFDTNNEFNTEDQTTVLDLNQAAINAIRAAGATSQYIFVEGNSWSGAWTWESVNDNLKTLTDPIADPDKLIYEMHQYLDSDGSGTSSTCVSATIGQERIESATAWLVANAKKAFLGEFAAGANSVCVSAVTGMLDYMEANADVWLGAEWWAAGPWWGDYIYSMEPMTGPAYEYYLEVLEPYFPGGSYTATSTATATATSSTTTAVTGTSTAVAQHWGQCGGQGWTGPTTCVSPYTCQVQNAYYSQCL